MFSADGQWLVVARGPSISVFNASGTVQHWANVFSTTIRDLDVGPDGTLAVTGAGERSEPVNLMTLSLPDLEDAYSLEVPAGYAGRFADDGSVFVHGNATGVVQLLDPRANPWAQIGVPLSGPHVPVLSASASPDARFVAATFGDGSVRLWDLATGHPAASLPSRTGVGAVAGFLRGGKRLVVVESDGHGYLWDLNPGSWLERACRVRRGRV